MLTPKLDPTYHKYDISPQEQEAGQQFNDFQLAVLQNLKMEVIEKRLYQELDPNDHLGTVQADAYSRGQLDILNQILSFHSPY